VSVLGWLATGCCHRFEARWGISGEETIPRRGVLELVGCEKLIGRLPLRQGREFDGTLDVNDRGQANEMAVCSDLYRQECVGGFKFWVQPAFVYLEQLTDGQENILCVGLTLVCGEFVPGCHHVALLEAVSKEK
jgi:hypothetical protein